MSDSEQVRGGYLLPFALLIGGSIVGTSGCAPPEPPRFTPSADVTALAVDAQTDEDKKLWSGLQHQIADELAKLCGSPHEPKAIQGSGLSEDRLAEGAAIFARRCQPCHGTNGDGNGDLAQYLKPRPRDYTRGIFKFTSTPYGSRPRRADLIRTLRRGVTGTSMPSFADLAPDDLEAVADYVIYLSQRGQLEHELVSLAQQEEKLEAEPVQETVNTIVGQWKDAQAKSVMPLTPMPQYSADAVAKGHELFLKQACNKCHGQDGRGGSFGGVQVGKDAWGRDAAAADLTSGMFHGGGRPIDIYRRIYSGINGTPMPSFADAYAKSPDDIWYLVQFIRDMGERRRRNLPPAEAPASDAVPAATSGAATTQAPVSQSASEP
jgi:mono/diheme cytochrome c family protein